MTRQGRRVVKQNQLGESYKSLHCLKFKSAVKVDLYIRARTLFVKKESGGCM